MLARRFILVISVLGAIALAGACGGATDSDSPPDGGFDAGIDATEDNDAGESATDGDAHSDAPVESSQDADADIPCACPAVAPLTGQPCCPTAGSCVYCNPSKWELTTASCKAGQWFSVTQWDTPCGTD